MKIKPSKLQTVTRCSYCHADDGEMEKCSGCGTLLHPECEKENGRCPTLGCAKPVKSESLAEEWNHWRLNPTTNQFTWATPRREGLYDTETWAPQNTTQRAIAFSLASWPTAVLHSNVNPMWNTTWTQTPITNPYYITGHLDGILTRPLRDEFAEPTEPDPMNTTEQF